MSGPENPFTIGRELGDWMTRNVTVTRYNAKLKETDQKIQELQARWSKVGLKDTGGWANQSLHYTRQIYSMLQLARVVTIGALNRDESRGAHYKPDFPDRDDSKFQKTTIATYKKGKDFGAPEFSWEAVDVSLIKPRPRKYDVDKATSTAKS